MIPVKAPPVKRKKQQFKKKECPFKNSKCGTPIHPQDIHYTDVDLLKKFIGPRGTILASRLTGAAPAYQKALAQAIKRARFIGLLVFVEKFELSR